MASFSNSKYLSKLANSRILVLGGTSGIGFCVAEAAVEHGAYVIVSGSRPEKLAKAIERLQNAYSDAKDRITGHTCDLSDIPKLEANLTSLLDAATTSGHKIDHIAFTAGDALQIKPVSEIDVEYIQRTGAVRFFAPLMLAKLLPKYVTPGPTSSFTITGGVNGTKPSPTWTVVAAWSTAGEGLARGLAVDLAPMRVNVVSPGAVRTELFDGLPRDTLDAVIRKYNKETTVGHIGRPEDTAEAYIYAMKDRFVTGSSIESNGGNLLK